MFSGSMSTNTMIGFLSDLFVITDCNKKGEEVPELVKNNFTEKLVSISNVFDKFMPWTKPDISTFRRIHPRKNKQRNSRAKAKAVRESRRKRNK